jgi:methylamine utilization protein MauE
LESEQAVETGARRREARGGKRTTLLVLRFLVAAVLAATAVGKLLDLPGFAEVLRSYRALPDFGLWPVAIGMPAAELAVAAWLVVGVRLRGAAFASAGLHAAYAVWSAVAVLRGLALPNCGCFGVFFKRPLGWHTVLEDAGMVGLSLAMAGLAGRRG